MSAELRNACPARLELVSKQLVVPDLAVVDDHDPSVLIRHRLRAAGNVDDREPCVAERNGRSWNVHSMPIGSAMTKRPNRAFQTTQVRKVCAYRRNGSGDAAHVRLQPAAASQRRGAIPLHEGTRRRRAPHALMERAPGTPSSSQARLVSFAVDSGRNAGSGRAPLSWYVHRAQAMSARELAWRTAAPVRARLTRTALRRPDWETPGWTELLERLAGTAAPATTAAAARIAGGELSSGAARPGSIRCGRTGTSSRSRRPGFRGEESSRDNRSEADLGAAPAAASRSARPRLGDRARGRTGPGYASTSFSPGSLLRRPAGVPPGRPVTRRRIG